MAYLEICIVGNGRRTQTLAQHLRARGYAPAIHDPAAPKELRAVGHRLPADAASGADLLVLDMSEERCYEDSVYQVGGVADTLPSGAAVLDLSPRGPSGARAAGQFFARYDIGYADGLLLNLVDRRRGERPVLLLGGGAAHHPAYDVLAAALGARKVHSGPTGSASLARLVLEDAYELALRFLEQDANGEPADGLDHVSVDSRTLASVTALVRERNRRACLVADCTEAAAA